MRATRLLAAGAALALIAALAGPAAAAPGALTFHGVFTNGSGYSSTGPADPVFAMPVTGTWNLNVNMAVAPGAGQARSSNIVRVPGGGLHARWVENELDLAPLDHESLVAKVIPELAGVRNDPANGIYAYETRLVFLDATMVVVLDTASGSYLYAAVPGPDFACAPGVAECYDSVLIEGVAR